MIVVHAFIVRYQFLPWLVLTKNSKKSAEVKRDAVSNLLFISDMVKSVFPDHISESDVGFITLRKRHQVSKIETVNMALFAKRELQESLQLFICDLNSILHHELMQTIKLELAFTPFIKLLK